MPTLYFKTETLALCAFSPSYVCRICSYPTPSPLSVQLTIYVDLRRIVLLYRRDRVFVIIVCHPLLHKLWVISKLSISCLQIYLTLLGFWESRKSVEFIWCLAGQLLPILGGVITIGLLQTPAVQSSFVVYLIVANVQCELSTFDTQSYRCAQVLISCFSSLQLLG